MSYNSSSFSNTKHCDTSTKAGYAVIMLSTPRSVELWDLWLLSYMGFTHCLDDTSEGISTGRVSVCLQSSCMLTLLARTKPETKATAWHTSWPAAGMCGAECGQSEVGHSCLTLADLRWSTWRSNSGDVHAQPMGISADKSTSPSDVSVTACSQTISMQFRQDQDSYKSQRNTQERFLRYL